MDISGRLTELYIHLGQLTTRRRRTTIPSQPRGAVKTVLHGAITVHGAHQVVAPTVGSRITLPPTRVVVVMLHAFTEAVDANVRLQDLVSVRVVLGGIRKSEQPYPVIVSANRRNFPNMRGVIPTEVRRQSF